MPPVTFSLTETVFGLRKAPRALLVLLLIWVGFHAPAARAEVREIATIDTSLGAMEFELWRDAAPRTVANFKYLADSRFYDGTVFHRLISWFMAQGGDPNTRGSTTSAYNNNQAKFGTGGPGYSIPFEQTDSDGHRHERGVLSMANSGTPNSAMSQFFIMFDSAAQLAAQGAVSQTFNAEYTTFGKIISGDAVLAAIQAAPTQTGDLPKQPVLIKTIRIRSEVVAGTVAPPAAFQTGTFSGLLRTPDRANIRGSYQVSLSSDGLFSGQVQYYGRRNAFVGRLSPADSSKITNSWTSVLNSTSAAPIRVRMTVRKTPAGTNDLCLSVCALNSSGADLIDDSFALAAGQLGSSNTLAEHYTAAFDPPLASANTLLVPHMGGFGFMTVNVRPNSGLALASMRLPDNSTFSFSRTLASEGGRFLLPLFQHDLLPDIENQRSSFAETLLSDWYGKYFNFNYVNQRIEGTLEMPPRADIQRPATSLDDYMIWFRAQRGSGIVQNQIATAIRPAIATWTPPSAGATLSSELAQLSVPDLLKQVTLPLQISPSNKGATFTVNTNSSAAAPILRFNPFDGTFQGSLVDSSSANKPRYPFQGVILQTSGNKGKAFGFLTTRADVFPVLIAP